MSEHSSARWWVRIVALAIVAVVPVAVATAQHPATAGAPVPAEALLVGDSVMNGMAQSYGLPARQLLAARHSFVLDTAGCRRLITTSCSIGGGAVPANALTVVRARAGQYNRVLVIGAGYNDPTTGSVGIGTAVDVLVAEAEQQGIHHVIWLTYREAGPSAARFRAHNGVLRAKTGTHPELLLADWAATSATMPTSWFSADGIHLGSDAAKGMAKLIADTIDRVPPDPPDNGCRIVDTTVVVATQAPPASVVDTIGGAALAPEPARRLQLWCP